MKLRTNLKLKNTRECLQDGRLKWFGHLERMQDRVWSSKCRIFKISGSRPRGLQRETRNEVMRSGLKERKVSKDTAKEKNAYKSCIRNLTTHANMENKQTLKQI